MTRISLVVLFALIGGLQGCGGTTVTVADEDALSDADDTLPGENAADTNEPAGQSSASPPPINEPDASVSSSVGQIQMATWLVVGTSEQSFFTATAFGVGPSLLATNAHVVEGLKSLFEEPGLVLATAFQHETGEQRLISTVWSHPDYDPNAPPTASPDLGLLKVDGEVPVRLKLAQATTLREIAIFDEVSLCGFPGDVTIGLDFAALLSGGETFHPRTTCLRGSVSALRPFSPSDPANPWNTHVIQYDLPTTPGTSGSAVLNEFGEVIGVNTAGFTTGGDYNFAVRSDKLEELMQFVDSGRLSGVQLQSIQPASSCSSTYYNSDWGFGFDLPAGFTGPHPGPLPELTLSVEFRSSHGDDTTFDLTVLSPVVGGLGALVQEWIVTSSSRHQLLRNERFETPTGQPAYLLVWRFPIVGDNVCAVTDACSYGIEAWTMGELGAYFLRTWISGDSAAEELGPVYEAAIKSLCVD